MVKMSLKGEVGGHALKSHGNYIVDHGKSWKNHGIVFLNFCGAPVNYDIFCQSFHSSSCMDITVGHDEDLVRF